MDQPGHLASAPSAIQGQRQPVCPVVSCQVTPQPSAAGWEWGLHPKATSLDHPPFPFPVTPADLELSGMRTLEHVAVTVTITHPRRGNLEIRLFCPSGMMSLIGTTRSMDS